MSPTGHHYRRIARLVACVLGIVLVGSVVPAGAKGDPEDLERVGIRHSRAGIVLRLYQSSFENFEGHLPKKCFPDQQLVVELSTRELATSAYFAGRSDSPLKPQGQVVGIAEHAPVAVVLARLPDDVERAEMVFRNGSTDRAEPLEDGWVMLASELTKVPRELDRVPLLNQPGPSLGRITFNGTAGERRRPVPVRTFGGDGSGSDPDCQPLPPPPPPLPDATGPPPADEPAARTAVEAAYTTVFSRADEDRDDRLAVIEDGESVRAASEEIAELYPEIGPTSVKIDEIRFLSETEAAVRFDILLDGNPITATTVGRALLIDGTWKIAKATYCELLSRGGVTC